MLNSEKLSGGQPGGRRLDRMGKQQPFNWARNLVGAVVRRWLALRYRVLSRRYGRLVLEEIDGVSLIILPEVFNPVLLRTGEFMARTLARIPLSPEGNGEGISVLDLGTGSGVGAIFAARRGADVIAVDINPDAVRCARLNALLNCLEDKIEVRLGDLFGPVAGEQFDVVLFNPPFHRGQPGSKLDHAWRGLNVFERFATELSRVLKPNGRALLVLSSDGDGQELLALLAANGYEVQVLAQKNLINEILTFYAVSLIK